MNTTTGSIDITGVFAAINREIALLKSRYARKAYCGDNYGCRCGHPCASSDCHACCDDMSGDLWVCDSCDLTLCGGDDCQPVHWQTTPTSPTYSYCSSCDEIRLSYGQLNYKILSDAKAEASTKATQLIAAAKAMTPAERAETARALARRMRANSGAECVYCHTHYVREHFNTDGKCMDCFLAPPDIDSDSEAAVHDSGATVHA